MRKLVAINTPSSGHDSDTPAWAAVRERLALYLRALALPESEAQRLLDASLAQARAADPAMPLSAAMATLHGLLDQREAACPPAPVCMPALSRAGMVPEKIERSPLRFFVSEFLQPIFLGGARHAQLHSPRLLLVCATVIGGLLLHRIG